ncbi:tRNA lysidine(34) synthetase TilS [Mitsuokella multacida]|uniref:tRNA lysidine(34) synthetase TilS n=1 Tax=Mitsuokella multacida TaxID=52226 RepID=UPI002430A78D|nr:tRNA lysidine(34) synthetase TilS [Mitsuokella multacida]MDO5582460.1 tRNA lysidine(34) synthetase TilS [Mitsuokella multacida]
MGRMLEEAVRYARAQDLLHPGMHVLVACSGGPDSLALLDMLLQFRRRFRLVLTAAHFEHGIRGASSAEDARFVAAFCRERKVPCFIGHGDVPAVAKAQGKSVELAARELRYAFLWRTLERCGADVLATAHHADDQAETVLMRILRGTGLDGLAAMKPREGKKIRPLLFARREDILGYCQERGLEPRHDATNDIPDCTRNLLRLKVLPYLRQSCNPEVARALCQLAELARVDCDYLEQQLEESWPYLTREEDGRRSIVLTAFHRRHPALQRRALRRLYIGVAGMGRDLGFSHVEELRLLALSGQATGKTMELPGGIEAHFTYDRLILRPALPKREPQESASAVPVIVPGRTDYGDAVIEAELLDALPASDGSRGFYLDADVFKGEPLVLRHRQPGDFIELPVGRKKLKEVLIDDKVPRERRAGLLLLAAGHEILWIVGRKRTSHYPVTEQTKRILYFQIKEKGNKK